MELFINSIKNELEELSSKSVSLKFIGNIQNLNTNLKEVIKLQKIRLKVTIKLFYQ